MPSRTVAEPSAPTQEETHEPRRWTRRRILTVGLGGAAGIVLAGAAGVELVSHGVLPGRQTLDQLDGECSAPGPPLRFATELGPTVSGSFHSNARRRTVGYTVAWPPGTDRGTPLPLIVMLHGFGDNHTNALTGMTPAQAVGLVDAGRRLPPMAMVTVDGGDGYWNPHPDDDPMAMVISELIPMCQSMHLGTSPQKIGIMGISMGGYGALLLAEKYPSLIRAAAAISPAIWTSYAEARSANPGAYASEAAFVANDAVTHTAGLFDTPVRVASGNDDPFHPGVLALAATLPKSATVVLSQGCHTAPFFTAQEPPSLQFLGHYLQA
jgi:enterochelin esterase-like enzyme